MQLDVVQNAKRNIVFGTINKTVLLLCPFIERTILHYILGSQYLGLNNLFASILSVLSLTELGFSSAMIYHMYKPVAEDNIDKVNALLNFYKKTYRIIGIMLIIIGLMLIPFLPSLIRGSYPKEVDLKVLYLMYLSNSAIGYFLYAYMESILIVHQRDDVQSRINSATRVLLMLFQTSVLFITKSYYLFLALMPLFTVVNNVWIAFRINRLFPYYKPTGNLNSNEKAEIKKLVTGAFIQRACSVTRNSMDSICLSAFLGLTLTAIYNNYYMIMNGITVFMGVFGAAFTGGVGNRVATRNVDDNFEELQKLDFVYLWIAGWCATCLVCFFQPFMQLWMGKEMMLPISAVVLLVLYFYLLKLGDIISLYSSAKGLWWEHRYRAIAETFLNIVLNIVLGKLYGIYGIIVATIISLFLCNCLWAKWLIFKYYFGLTYLKMHYYCQVKQTLILIAASIVSYVLCSYVSTNHIFFSLIVRVMICIIIPNLFCFLFFHKTKEYQYAVSRIDFKSF